MTDVAGRYPLSTAEGTPIPLEVIRPYGTVSKTFTAVGASSTVDVPATVDVFSVLSTEDCVIQFAASSASASALVDGVLTADAITIVANLLTTVSPPIDKRNMSLRGLTASGSAYFNFYEKWAGLSLSPQSTRR